MFQNSANLFILKFKCAKFQKFLFFQKNGLSSSGILKKKFRFSNLKSDFFQLFQKKSQMFQNSANLFVLKYQCAKFQKFLFFQKNDLWSSGNLNQNFRFSNFKSEFFLIFQKKRQKTRKFRTFIYREPHVSQFWAKSEKLFSGRSGGRSGGGSLSLAALALFSGEGRRS